MVYCKNKPLALGIWLCVTTTNVQYSGFILTVAVSDTLLKGSGTVPLAESSQSLRKGNNEKKYSLYNHTIFILMFCLYHDIYL